MAKAKILKNSEIQNEISGLPDWEVVNGKIEAKFEFSDFRTAFAFISLVAIEAEVQNHHPEWFNSYKRVEFSLNTHSVGNKITDLDFTLANYISETAQKFKHAA